MTSTDILPQKMTAERLVIEIHGAANVLELLKNKPEDANYIAVPRHKCGSIFYRIEQSIDVDYGHGQGWILNVFKSKSELEHNLRVASFILANIPLLEKELELYDLVNGFKHSCLKRIEQQIATKIETVDLRRKHDGRAEYWKGHKEAFEIAQHMIRAAVNQG